MNSEVGYEVGSDGVGADEFAIDSGNKIIVPEWPAPSNVRVLISTRDKPISANPTLPADPLEKQSNTDHLEKNISNYEAFNLGDHVGDSSGIVAKNRIEFATLLGADIQWLQQTHSTDITEIKSKSQLKSIAKADGSITELPGVGCCVMTADCLPVLLCDQQGTKVSAIHCGWRGLADGMLSKAFDKFAQSGDQLLAYMGPAISQACFEVGEDVKGRFEQAANERGYTLPNSAFVSSDNQGKYRADLYSIAKAELQNLGINQIFGGGYCTFTESDRFYSYRRSSITGRMASAICIVES